MEQFMVCSIIVSFLVHPRFLVQCNTGAWLPRSLTAAQAASRLYSSHTQHQFGSNVAKTVGWDPSILNIWGIVTSMKRNDETIIQGFTLGKMKHTIFFQHVQLLRELRRLSNRKKKILQEMICMNANYFI